MRVLLIYYTGTYNTRYLTNKVKARFEAQGDTVDVVEIHCDTKPVQTTGYDLVGFSYPIYGFNAPRPFEKYVKQLRFQKGQKFFIYKNSGETLAMNSASSRILLHHMEKNGAVLAGEYHYVMPYNIHFAFERDFIREIFKQNEKLMDIMLYNLNHGRVAKIKSNFIYNTASFFVAIQKIGGDVNSFLYTVDHKKCTRCGKCIRACPQKNIYEKNGKIRFHHHCDMCMRCSFYCPTDAINIGFLQGWKVNNPYDYNEIEADTSPVRPYITKDSTGFYKCFIKYFALINKEHQKLFPSGKA